MARTSRPRNRLVRSQVRIETGASYATTTLRAFPGASQIETRTPDMEKISSFTTYGRTFGWMLAGLLVVVALLYLGVPNA